MKKFINFFQNRIFLRASKTILHFVILLFSLENSFSQNNLYSYTIPEKLNDGWKVSSLSKAGIDEKLIESVTQKIRSNRFKGINGYLIVKGGAVVHEVYFNGYKQSSLQTIFSITKSISSTLIGIAIDKGYIKSVDESVLSLLPQYVGYINDPVKHKIKLEHLLTISSGLEWNESNFPYSDLRNTETQMVRTKDWMKFVLTRPQKYVPGEKFIYNTGSVHLLSGIIKKSSGLFADKFTEKFLFTPLGITEYEWNKDPMGYQCTGATHGGLKLKARDLAKFGRLILNKGKWKGRQIVSEKWIKEATKKHIDTYFSNDCGYLWWPGSRTVNNKKIDIIASFGYGGQAMFLIPEFDTVIIFTCWSNEKDAETLGPVFMTFKAIAQQ